MKAKMSGCGCWTLLLALICISTGDMKMAGTFIILTFAFEFIFGD